MKHDNATHSSSQGTQIAYAGYIGMDTHKDTITVAIALAGRTPAAHCCEIRHTAKAVKTLLQRLSKEFEGAVVIIWL